MKFKNVSLYNYSRYTSPRYLLGSGPDTLLIDETDYQELWLRSEGELYS